MATLPILPSLRKKREYNVRKECVSSKKYKELFRFNEENVEWISNYFLGFSNETRGGALSNKTRMEIFLRYISDPGFQTGVGYDIGVDQSTVSKTVKHVTRCINEKMNDWIKFPTTYDEVLEAKNLWHKSNNKLPNVIGAIDCTHVKIYKTKYEGDEYINRKGVPTINIQATVNSSEIFTSVDASWPGSVHDSRIFHNSSILPILKNNSNLCCLIGDSGYGIAPWLITPYKSPKTAQELYFNKIYAKERVVVERVFGQLKRRFPSLHYKVRVKLEKIPSFIISCFVMHNIAKYLNDPDDFNNELETYDEEGEIDENETFDSNISITLAGRAKRNRMSEIIFMS